MSEEVNFGFRKVKAEIKQRLVNQVFDSVFNRYDIMNDLMSFGIHRMWKKSFVAMIDDYSKDLLDVAAGTGDISLRFCQQARQKSLEPKVTLSDINNSMLGEARKKLIDQGFYKDINFACANAESLPFEVNSFDFYTIAFGLRNCTDIEQVIKEAYRVLKPGGKFLCLEFSQIDNPIFKTIYNLYSEHIIPLIGGCVTGDRESYEYLVESIALFPKQEELKELIIDCGFNMVRYVNLTQGVVAIHVGHKI